MAAVELRIGPLDWAIGEVEDDESPGVGDEDGTDEDWAVHMERKGRGKRKRSAPASAPRSRRRPSGQKRRRAAAPVAPEPPASPARSPSEPAASPEEGFNAAATTVAAVGVKEEDMWVRVRKEEGENMAPSTSGRGGGGKKPGGRRSCHQCKRVRQRPQEMIRCQRCDERIYCEPCVRNR